MKYCADCYHMEENSDREGLFRCLNSRKSQYTKVPATKIANSCNGFGEAFISRRSEREREALIRISHNHGYYLTSIITKVMGLPEDNEYLDAFRYIRDVYMPEREEYQEFIEAYEYYGPGLAEKLSLDENKEYCGYLFKCYLEPFSALVFEEEIVAAIDIYQSMFDDVKRTLSMNVGESLLLYNINVE